MTLPKRGGTARATMSEKNRRCLILNTFRRRRRFAVCTGANNFPGNARTFVQLPAGRRRYPIFLHLGGARTMARPRSVVRGRSYRFESEVRTGLRTKKTTTPTTRWLHARALLPLLLSLTGRPTGPLLFHHRRRGRAGQHPPLQSFGAWSRSVRTRRTRARASVRWGDKDKMAMP